MSSPVADILQVAKGLAAGGTITLVGLNGNVINVTDEGFLESIDTTVVATVNSPIFGNEQIFEALGAAGGVGGDLDTILSRLSSVRAGNLDELDFDLSARLGSPSGVSLAADIAANQVDMNSLIANLTAVQTDLDNGVDGLGALKTLIDANQADLNTTITDVATVDTVVDTLATRLSAARAGYLDELDFDVNARLGSPVGISLAADLLENQVDLNSLITSLATVDTEVGSLQTDLDNAVDGLGALKTLIDANQADLNTTISNIATVDTVVDGLQTDLSNGVDGLGALKSLIDENQVDLNSVISKVNTVDTEVGDLQTDLDNASDGLGALKSLIDANQADLNTTITDVATVDGIVNTINTNVNTVNTDLSNVTDGLGALKSLIDANQGDLNSLISSLSTVDTEVGNLQTDLSNATDGLGALKILIDANQADLNTTISNLATVDTEVGELQTDLSNATDGLGALKALIDTMDGVVDGIQTDLDNSADGLGKIATELSGAASTGTYSYTADTNEQDAIEITQTNIYSILSLHLDLAAFTSGRVITARVYSKVDGTTYRLMDTVLYTVGTHNVISISPQMNLNHHWKITIQIDLVESGAKNVPYRYVLVDFT